MDLYQTIIGPFAEFDFMRYALASVVFLALSAAPVGVFLMLRRMSLTGDAMAHGILPGAALALGLVFLGNDLGTVLILGAIVGTLLVSSGGADVIVDTILAKTPLQRLPWAMALIAFVIGIPLFFGRRRNLDGLGQDIPCREGIGLRQP